MGRKNAQKPTARGQKAAAALHTAPMAIPGRNSTPGAHPWIERAASVSSPHSRAASSGMKRRCDSAMPRLPTNYPFPATRKSATSYWATNLDAPRSGLAYFVFSSQWLARFASLSDLVLDRR